MCVHAWCVCVCVFVCVYAWCVCVCVVLLGNHIAIGVYMYIYISGFLWFLCGHPHSNRSAVCFIRQAAS